MCAGDVLQRYVSQALCRSTVVLAELNDNLIETHSGSNSLHEQVNGSNKGYAEL